MDYIEILYLAAIICFIFLMRQQNKTFKIYRNFIKLDNEMFKNNFITMESILTDSIKIAEHPEKNQKLLENLKDLELRLKEINKTKG